MSTNDFLKNKCFGWRGLSQIIILNYILATNYDHSYTRGFNFVCVSISGKMVGFLICF